MKKLFSILLVFFTAAAFAQTRPTVILGDTIRLESKNANGAILQIKNSTKDVAGFLYNKGGGVTEFRQAVIVNPSPGIDSFNINEYRFCVFPSGLASYCFEWRADITGAHISADSARYVLTNAFGDSVAFLPTKMSNAIGDGIDIAWAGIGANGLPNIRYKLNKDSVRSFISVTGTGGSYNPATGVLTLTGGSGSSTDSSAFNSVTSNSDTSFTLHKPNGDSSTIVIHGGGGTSTISFTPTGDVTGAATGTSALNPVLTIGPLKVINSMIANSTINLTTKVTGNLPVTNLGSGTGASSSTFWRGDGTWVTPGGSGTVTGGSITWPGTLYSSPTTGSVGSGTLTFAPTLASQSAYTLFGRGSGSGTPSFLSSIDSNWIPALHSQTYYDLRYAAIGGGGGGSYAFLNGLTNSAGNVSNNLITGISGGSQKIVSGNSNGDSLFIAATTTGKGKTFLADAMYDESNSQFHLLTASAAQVIPRGLFYFDTTRGATRNRVASLQALFNGSNSFALLAVNKHFNGSAWVDNGLSRAGGVLQVQDNILGFYQYNTGTTGTQRFQITSLGYMTVGDFQSTGITAAGNLDVRGTDAWTLSIGHTLSNIYRYGIGRSSTGQGYLIFQPDASNPTPGFQFVGGPFGIGATAGTAIGASVKFQVTTTTQGSIPFPVMTAAQRAAISSPAIGLHVYQSDGTEGVYVNKSTGWQFAY